MSQHGEDRIGQHGANNERFKPTETVSKSVTAGYWAAVGDATAQQVPTAPGAHDRDKNKGGNNPLVNEVLWSSIMAWIKREETCHLRQRLSASGMDVPATTTRQEIIDLIFFHTDKVHTILAIVVCPARRG